jgi:hypothetical protein
MVQTSNFIGFMLEAAADRSIRSVLLFGHIGKLSKVSAGVFYTHNRIADARLESMAAYAACCRTVSGWGEGAAGREYDRGCPDQSWMKPDCGRVCARHWHSGPASGPSAICSAS